MGWKEKHNPRSQWRAKRFGPVEEVHKPLPVRVEPVVHTITFQNLFILMKDFVWRLFKKKRVSPKVSPELMN